VFYTVKCVRSDCALNSLQLSFGKQIRTKAESVKKNGKNKRSEMKV